MLQHFTIDFQISFEKDTLEVLKGLIAQPRQEAKKRMIDDEECPISIPVTRTRGSFSEEKQEIPDTDDPGVALLAARGRGVKFSVINQVLNSFGVSSTQECPPERRAALADKFNTLMPE